MPLTTDELIAALGDDDPRPTGGDCVLLIEGLRLLKRRYLLFVGFDWAPPAEFAEAFETPEGATAAGAARLDTDAYTAHVMDAMDGSVVWSGKNHDAAVDPDA
jgi:hypothetical protein